MMRLRALAFSALALAACGPSDAGEAADDPFVGLSEGWNLIDAPDHTGCSHGTDFAFWFRPASTERVAVYFQGGGACWFGENCALDRSPSYDPAVDESDAPPGTGIFDFTSERNPIREWSVLYVPYCTADVHVGSTTRTYAVEARDTLPAGEVEIRHIGDTNATAALDWLFERVDDPTRILVTGVSAGSLGAAAHAHTIARRFPESDVVQVGDAAGGYRAPEAVPAVLDAWGANSTLDRITATRGTVRDFEALYGGAADPPANLRMARINYHEDEVQLSFLSMLGVTGRPLVELLDANLADIRAESSTFVSYMLPGARHGIIRGPEFYEATVDGVALPDWMSGLIAGEDVGSVDCEVCR